MLGERKIVAIDADFFNKFTENNPNGQLFLDVMNELNIFPVMHQYVYEYELAGNSTAKALVDQGNMRVIDYDDYLPEDRNAYENAFLMAYQSFNFADFNVKRYNIYTYHHEKENLGEIRTALMAFYMGIELMMSDDGGAKKYITERISSRRHPLIVYNVYDALIAVGNVKNRKMKWGEVRGFAKRVFLYNMKLYEEINEVWHT